MFVEFLAHVVQLHPPLCHYSFGRHCCLSVAVRFSYTTGMFLPEWTSPVDGEQVQGQNYYSATRKNLSYRTTLIPGPNSDATDQEQLGSSDWTCANPLRVSTCVAPPGYDSSDFIYKRCCGAGWSRIRVFEMGSFCHVVSLSELTLSTTPCLIS